MSVQTCGREIFHSILEPIVIRRLFDTSNTVVQFPEHCGTTHDVRAVQPPVLQSVCGRPSWGYVSGTRLSREGGHKEFAVGQNHGLYHTQSSQNITDLWGRGKLLLSPN